ncbi:MAG: tRNA (5-methylaminomethyl-2-thiouridine)(34)-methyltransferase MnmD [Pseudomonadota bacterium]
MTHAPRSTVFDDIYFSREDGLAETRHVFLQGNDLPQSWQEHDVFHVAECGFGTGLNALATAALFLKTTQPHQHLVFSSIEKYPLTRDEVSSALSHWGDEFAGLLETLCAQLPLRLQGEHPILLHPRVTLILHYGDIAAGMQAIGGPVNAWFLDGFSPAKNPDMWQQPVFNAMRAKSAENAAFATFTAAGFVKRGLQQAGFAVEKVPGFGRKREMLRGRLQAGLGQAMTGLRKGRIAIVGGGLAGCAAAYWARHYGIDATIFETEDRLASGASGNPTGLFNPRFSQEWNDAAHMYSSAYALFARTVPTVPSGNLHLLTKPDRAARLTGFAQNWGWHTDHVRLVNAREASDIAGIAIAHDALYLPDGGPVSPVQVCQDWAGSTPLIPHINSAWDMLQDQYDAVVLANGAGVKDYAPAAHLPLQTVRGQIIRMAAHTGSASLKANVQYGGYMSVPLNGLHTAGATFQPWLTDTALRDDDTAHILNNLAKAVPSMAFNWTVVDGRAALRTTTPGRTPLIGHCGDGCFVSTAHGSHGLITSLWGGWTIIKALRFGWPIKTL